MGCGLSTCRKLLEVFEHHSRSNEDQPLGGGNTTSGLASYNNGGDPFIPNHHPDGFSSTPASQGSSSGPNGEVHSETGGGTGELAGHNLNITGNGELPGQTESDTPHAVGSFNTAAAQPHGRTSSDARRQYRQHSQLFASPSTSNHEEKVVDSFRALQDKVVRFVDGYLDPGTNINCSRARAQIYRLIISLVQDKEANSNSKAYEEVADKIVDAIEEFPKLTKPSRTQTDIFSICGAGKTIKENISNDPALWKFYEEDKKGRKLEFPCSERDGQLADEGICLESTREGAMGSEEH